ncbi:MAG: cellulase family glycosylhydrolase [Actinomycetota bacterium]|nr:cellulase family glycosylhydrolase [Actinomycetota bacterium]
MWSDYSDAERELVLDKLAAAGLQWVRIDLGWQSLQEQGPTAFSQWYVDSADQVVEMAHQRGLKVLMTLWGTPGWANGNAGRAVPPTDPSDYARAATFVARHFAGRVEAFEVWNEPNEGSFWTGTASRYTNLLKAAYPAFKLGNPNAQVVLGGPSYNDTDWLEDVYAAGGAGYFDIMSTHPYQGVADAPPETPDDGTIWTLSHVAAVHDLMVLNGDGDKEIWFTEMGWSSHANQGNEANWQRGVTEAQQGDYFVRTIEYVTQRHPYVTNIFWYNERNRDSSDVQLANYGLLRRDFSDKPAYTAIKGYLTSGTTPPEAEETSPTPVPVPVDPIEVEEQLVNGGFEAGRTGWESINASLSTTSAGLRGRALKATRRGRTYGIASSSVDGSSGTTVTVAGFLRAPRADRKITLVVTESRGGEILKRKVVETRTRTSWTSFPKLSFRSSGLPGSRLRLKVEATGNRAERSYFLVDELSLKL